MLIYAKKFSFGLIYANICQKIFILNNNFMIFELFLTTAHIGSIYILYQVSPIGTTMPNPSL